MESKVEEITEELGKKVKELQVSKGLLNQREVALNGLREEVEYKNKQLAAKVKELEGKVSESSSASQ